MDQLLGEVSPDGGGAREVVTMVIGIVLVLMILVFSVVVDVARGGRWCVVLVVVMVMVVDHVFLIWLASFHYFSSHDRLFTHTLMPSLCLVLLLRRAVEPCPSILLDHEGVQRRSSLTSDARYV
jgi:small-conductance mechanosensitive channel